MPRTIFATDKKENARSKLKRIGFNFFPAYRRTGARICFLSDDFKEIHITLSLNWKTRNYVGSVFGGCIYGALDPIYMVQLINLLGGKYIVWDKKAEVKFIKPVKKKVYSRFLITDEIMKKIISAVESQKKCEMDFISRLEDKDGTVYAEVTKTLYIVDKEYYVKQKSERCFDCKGAYTSEPKIPATGIYNENIAHSRPSGQK
ncbi:MAG: DUF4442 domain-containing protein [Spirochaetes bacterium]|nr:DUF4442 domain-containing protein [Spirochaetota bacterium]